MRSTLKESEVILKKKQCMILDWILNQKHNYRWYLGNN